VRHLFQPRVLLRASAAAAVTALACYPQLLLWLNRPESVWLLDLTIFVCSIVLWGFVLAWHTQYTHRPVLVFKPPAWPFIAVTLLALGGGAAVHEWLDPILRPHAPEEYPSDLNHWAAEMLFGLFLSQLFVLFAPFAWLMRLFKNLWVAAILTAMWGVFLLVIENQSLSLPVPPPLFVVLVAGRIIMGLLGVWFYLRGGILLIWWWAILYEARHLLDLM
jgi:hypothetical protein